MPTSENLTPDESALLEYLRVAAEISTREERKVLDYQNLRSEKYKAWIALRPENSTYPECVASLAKRVTIPVRDGDGELEGLISMANVAS